MKLAFIDVETTGTNPERHAIVQLAGILVNGTQEREFNLFVRPGPNDELDPEALAVHKLSEEEVRAYPAPRKIHRTLTETYLAPFVDRYNRTDKFHLIAYNAPFDADFLRSFFTKCCDKYFGSWFWWPPIDVAVLAMDHLVAVRHTLPNFKLATVAKHLGLEPDGDLHDALVDIRLTRRVWERMSATTQTLVRDRVDNSEQRVNEERASA